MPTLAEIAGAESPANLDGISFAPALPGRDEQHAKHDFLYEKIEAWLRTARTDSPDWPIRPKRGADL